MVLAREKGLACSSSTLARFTGSDLTMLDLLRLALKFAGQDCSSHPDTAAVSTVGPDSSIALNSCSVALSPDVVWHFSCALQCFKMPAMWSVSEVQVRSRSLECGSNMESGNTTSKSWTSRRQSFSSLSRSFTIRSSRVRASWPAPPSSVSRPSMRLVRRVLKNCSTTLSVCLYLSKCKCPTASRAASAESCSVETQIGGRPSRIPPGPPVSLLHSSRGSNSPMTKCCKLTSCPSSAKGTAGIGASTGSRESNNAIQSAAPPSSQSSASPPLPSPRRRLRRLGALRLMSRESAQQRSAQAGAALAGPRSPQQRRAV
mmetsp:Transcript_42568/g.132408  ORF Transcript_42568/g.132408 Transcript_42568/m.132408 type:complete len:316 (-) Transcript_42568:301-1248(-)